MSLANLSIDNTFYDWLTRTNQLVVVANELTDGNLTTFGSINMQGPGVSLNVANNSSIYGDLYLKGVGEVLNISPSGTATILGIANVNTLIIGPVLTQNTGSHAQFGYVSANNDLSVGGRLIANSNIDLGGGAGYWINIAAGTLIVGDGSRLTNINASSITTGTINLALLNITSANISVNTSGALTGGSSSIAPGGGVTLNVNVASTVVRGVVQLTDATNSNSITTAATPNSVNTLATILVGAYAQANAAYNAANAAANTGNVEYQLTDAGTISWDVSAQGPAANVTLGGNRTLANATNIKPGKVYILRVINPNNYLLSFQRGYIHINNTAPQPGSMPNTSIVTCYSDGTYMYVSVGSGYRQ